MVHKLRNLKLYFMKSNISKFSDFELYLFSTVLFTTLKTRSEKHHGTGLIPAKNLPVPAQIPPEPVPDRNRNSGRVLVLTPLNSPSPCQILSPES